MRNFKDVRYPRFELESQAWKACMLTNYTNNAEKDGINYIDIFPSHKNIHHKYY